MEEHIQPISNDEARRLAGGVPQWKLGEKTLEREFRFKDFNQAMAFVNAVAELAVRRDHHPDIAISWNRVTLTLSTHSVGGLSRADFELAGEIDSLAAPRAAA
jgi:4a-hydroxytetrahydrobiopterin dehydratase